jgi:hypothetical protein
MKLKTKQERYDFLNEFGGGYYRVEYGFRCEILFFNQYSYDDKFWWLESPIDVREYSKNFDFGDGEVIQFIKDYGLIIADGSIYDIDLPQVSPFLPEEVELTKCSEIDVILDFIKLH